MTHEKNDGHDEKTCLTCLLAATANRWNKQFRGNPAEMVKCFAACIADIVRGCPEDIRDDFTMHVIMETLSIIVGDRGVRMVSLEEVIAAIGGDDNVTNH